MSIRLERKNGELLLHYAPESWDVEEFFAHLEFEGERTISRCFTVSQNLLRSADDDEECCFCIGEVQDEYTLIHQSVLSTTHRFFLANDIKPNIRYFVADQISILKRIDDLVDADVYIGGSYDKAIPLSTYETLLKHFPKKAEMRRYANARISTILKEHFPGLERHEKKFQRLLEQKDAKLNSELGQTQWNISLNTVIEHKQMIALRDDLNELLKDADSIPEATWQLKIQNILRFLYPQYIVAAREIVIKGVDAHDKRPDFLLVDVNGYVHLLEIKKPAVQLLTKQSSYRNNYVPVRELAGAIQQIDKYIHCLTKWGTIGETKLMEQLKERLPEGMTPRVVSPQGILLLGRSNGFNDQQRNDFELIKKSHKHVADILTYDDVIMRLNNSINALQMDLDEAQMGESRQNSQ